MEARDRVEKSRVKSGQVPADQAAKPARGAAERSTASKARERSVATAPEPFAGQSRTVAHGSPSRTAGDRQRDPGGGR